MHIPLLSARLRRRAAVAPPSPARPAYAMHRVASPEDWVAVRTLRFAAHAHHQDLPRDAVKSHWDAFDNRAGTTTFLLLRDGSPHASTRASVAPAGEPGALPAAVIFPREIEQLAGGARVVEASLTVVDPAASDMPTAVFHLFRAHMLACAAAEAAWLVTMVRDSQIGFYRRVFDMEILTGAERVPGLAVPRVLMGLRPGEQSARLARRIPLLAVHGADAHRFEEDAVVTFDPPCT
jgi:hypothetical protein